MSEFNAVAAGLRSPRAHDSRFRGRHERIESCPRPSFGDFRLGDQSSSGRDRRALTFRGSPLEQSSTTERDSRCLAVRRDSGHLRLARVGVEARGAKGSFEISIVSLHGFSMRNNGKFLRRGYRLRTSGLGRSHAKTCSNSVRSCGTTKSRHRVVAGTSLQM